jgi:hypothetical protein
MARANTHSTTTPLSSHFRDPFVRSAFERAERDLPGDQAALVEEDHPRSLDGGAAERLCGSTLRRLPVLVDA